MHGEHSQMKQYVIEFIPVNIAAFLVVQANLLFDLVCGFKLSQHNIVGLVIYWWLLLGEFPKLELGKRFDCACDFVKHVCF